MKKFFGKGNVNENFMEKLKKTLRANRKLINVKLIYFSAFCISETFRK